nr:hypothetical protein [Thermosporothrix hazakensis]
MSTSDMLITAPICEAARQNRGWHIEPLGHCDESIQIGVFVPRSLGAEQSA